MNVTLWKTYFCVRQNDLILCQNLFLFVSIYVFYSLAFVFYYPKGRAMKVLRRQ